MAIREVTLTEYTCDGCGVVRLGTLGEDVIGIAGTAMAHDTGGGHGADWFACSRRCVGTAVDNALNRALEE